MTPGTPELLARLPSTVPGPRGEAMALVRLALSGRDPDARVEALIALMTRLERAADRERTDLFLVAGLYAMLFHSEGAGELSGVLGRVLGRKGAGP